ncbi:MAG: acetyl-CoA carboxylase carboxyltransferase subunit alpha [Candidatus Hydrogenedentota bacterium]|uniref:Acetyl-coenzyme A carboxylase carboxyl transferase subunit alpha n=1 Tax=Sumerlaea chitinivorans TaxID=2250252 RepID=A0A2Z4Y540_SUMC1|nr:Acetyl-coenzyme A carboxyl transferase alpha chain [Candidatus Sumerlaea chitinivorans]RMH24280.1 MAG: acetyl-CoA carboxylase carboxyltransferase subunit alpha [Candidatus Hydrogenedentota bacterium]GIX45024.1 MAG: acetyl-coenzyme A carboxylase carboxyl transferase subunit alpha [Candidatus Sumerlaea sp.]
MTITAFDFEKPLIELENQLHELEKQEPRDEGAIQALREELERKQREVYTHLTPWQRVLLARHLERPHSLDYVHALMTNFIELHGDRGFADDKAVVTGFATFRGQRLCVVCQQKGRDTKENLMRNWGMMHPEGYRKAMRVMRLGEKFGMPIVVFIDTPGAFPGIGAEERGQAEAIARNIRDMFTLQVPIICIVVGEGASGGALGVGVGDRVLMLENSWYCVISPEGCAAILWKDRGLAERAAEQLKLTASDLIQLNVIDEIIPEPLGGAHRKPKETYETVGTYLARHLGELARIPTDQLLDLRYQKFRAMGRVVEVEG